MGRKVLIQEQRLTSRTYLNLLRKAQREGIEVRWFDEKIIETQAQNFTKNQYVANEK